MRFLVDESVHGGVVGFLERSGHNATAIGRDYPYALPDHEILATCVEEDRILVTSDRDFSDLVYDRQHGHTGVIYLRLRDADLDVIERRLSTVLDEVGDSFRDFLVITLRTIRRRS